MSALSARLALTLPEMTDAMEDILSGIYSSMNIIDLAIMVRDAPTLADSIALLDQYGNVYDSQVLLTALARRASNSNGKLLQGDTNGDPVSSSVALSAIARRVVGGTTDHIMKQDASGDPADSGILYSNVLVKPTSPTAGAVPVYDSNGQLSAGLALGVAALNIPQMDGSGYYPAGDGRNIVGLPHNLASSATVAATDELLAYVTNANKKITVDTLFTKSDTIVLLPGGMTPTTDGASAVKKEMSTTKRNITYVEFPMAVKKYFEWELYLPNGYDGGNLYFSFVWTVNDTTVAWGAGAAKSSGDYVKPSTRNGYVYKCTTAGTTAGTEPTWPTTPGNTVTDGGAVWTCILQKVRWGAQAFVAGDGVDLDTAYGTAQELTDQSDQRNYFQFTTFETSAVVPAGTLAGGKSLFIRVYRDGTNSTEDTLQLSAGLIMAVARFGRNKRSD
jgi:hypothetical protein